MLILQRIRSLFDRTRFLHHMLGVDRLIAPVAELEYLRMAHRPTIYEVSVRPRLRRHDEGVVFDQFDAGTLRLSHGLDCVLITDNCILQRAPPLCRTTNM